MLLAGSSKKISNISTIGFLTIESRASVEHLFLLFCFESISQLNQTKRWQKTGICSVSLLLLLICSPLHQANSNDFQRDKSPIRRLSGSFFSGNKVQSNQPRTAYSCLPVYDYLCTTHDNIDASIYSTKEESRQKVTNNRLRERPEWMQAKQAGRRQQTTNKF